VCDPNDIDTGTGGNNGIGKETVRTLLERNAKVYMASRSKSKAEAAIAELKQDTGKEAIFLELDLSSLQSVRKAAEEFIRCVFEGYIPVSY
jgi:retinol dehydrogenase-12